MLLNVVMLALARLLSHVFIPQNLVAASD
jgi:hypothetical protein